MPLLSSLPPFTPQVKPHTRICGLGFYLVAFAMLSALGAGPALLLPRRLTPFAWALAPYLGYSLLVSGSSLIVAAGGTVLLALVPCALLSAIILVFGLPFVVGSRSVPSFASVVPVLLLSVPSYSITALAMARQGTLGYVGPLIDPWTLIRSSEWLKFHPAPLLSPTWYSNFPPLDGWAEPGARLAAVSGDPYFVLQRGVRYWESAIGILLRWDSALVFRSAQAFLLSLAGPATYLFCRGLLGASKRVALFAGVLVALNGTNLYWISLGHPGQAAFGPPSFRLPSLSP